ncbi:MAG: DNA polymerase, partial [Gemmatimonadota bacterium]
MIATRLLLEAVALGEVIAVAHNAAYDVGVVTQAASEDRAWGVEADLSLSPIALAFQAYRADGLSCTMIREKLRKIALGRARHDPTQGGRPRYSLAALALEHRGVVLGGKGADAWRLRYHELDGVPLADWPMDAIEYPKADVAHLPAIWRAQRPSADFGDLVDRWPDEQAQCRAHWALHLTAAAGLRTDAESVERLEALLEARIAEVIPRMQQAGLVRPNGSIDDKALRAAVGEAYRRQGEEPPQTAKGAVSRSSEALAESGDPLLVAWGQVSSDRTELSNSIPLLRTGTRLPINTYYDPLKVTGRTGSARPALQNQPRRPGVRECFCPRPGRIFASIDYAAAELVAFAQILIDVVGFSELAEVLRRGLDPHKVTGADLAGCSYEELTTAIAAGDKDAQDWRQLGKAVNFGVGGGLGPDAFRAFAAASYGVDIDEDEAARVLAAVKSRYPEIHRYLRHVGQMVDQGGGSILFTHPTSDRLYEIEGGRVYSRACNAPFQGMVADGAKAALFAVAEECYVGEPCPHCDGLGLAERRRGAPACPSCEGRGYRRGALYGSRPVIFLHDEIVAEVPSDPAEATAAADRLAEVMV